MVSLPGWGGYWAHKERLESVSNNIAKKRYNLPHPRVHQTPCAGLLRGAAPGCCAPARCAQIIF